jgi:TPP-dependent pyruvate/acetoin dehydrogenase alpha subunit
LQGRPQITACFFGDGAVAEGEFHESLNLAALWRLPVLFLCENNYYAMGTALARHQSQPDIARKAEAYDIPSAAVDGMDVLAVEAAARDAANAVRQDGRPFLLELRTYRFRAHSMYDPDLYRPREEVERWKRRDPILLLRAHLEAQGWLPLQRLREMEERVAAEIAAAVAFAESGPLEPVDDLLTDVYTQAAR